MKSNINLSYDADNLSALDMFMKQKNLDIKTELLKHLESLYQKHVPSNVREFIGMKATEKPGKKALKSEKIISE